MRQSILWRYQTWIQSHRKKTKMLREQFPWEMQLLSPYVKVTVSILIKRTLSASGYLKVVESKFDSSTGRYRYRLALTNQEVKMLFEDMVEGWFSDEDVPYNEFLQAFLAKDLDYMNEYMNRVAKATFSMFDTGKKPSEDRNPDRFYHGFVLGLMVELEGKYHVTSNRESGFGRYDVMLEPLDKNQDAFILEFKVLNPRKEKSLEDTVANALQQIRDKNYDSELLSKGIPYEHIFHFGFAFEGKRVLIGG